uniref:Uncharacterized protein n=1 Tax=Esox lucius TaxID=8010 RepID=A0AAY5L5B9_ESOLU
MSAASSRLTRTTFYPGCAAMAIYAASLHFTEQDILMINPKLPNATATEDAERDITVTVMGNYLIRRDGEAEDVGIVIEGVKFLSHVGNVIMGFIMLFGLIYALDLSFPDKLKYLFQKVIRNAKIQQLKIKLFS